MTSTTIASAIFTAGLAAAAGQYAVGSLSVARPTPVSNVVRVISDPSTGDRWLLERDPVAPGGPGRLVRLSAGQEPPLAANDRIRNEKALPPRAIRAGDRIVVEEHTAVMDAELEGVALNGARTGATLRVRLKIGGRVVSAVAEGPGCAVIQHVTGTQP